MTQKELNEYLNSILVNVEKGKLDSLQAHLLIIKTIKQAKKEVFDDIDNALYSNYNHAMMKGSIENLKKKHKVV